MPFLLGLQTPKITSRCTVQIFGIARVIQLYVNTADFRASCKMTLHNPFSSILALEHRKAVILDGGFGTELERQGKNYAQDPLWSARILADDPQAVKRVHRSYYDAGADVGTSCSYQASHSGFENAGFSREEAEQLFKRSVQLTAAARDEFWRHYQVQESMRTSKVGASAAGSWTQRRVRPLVAFSSGPYAATLADGSEYTGDYVDRVTFEQLVDFHRRKLQAVQGEDFDVIAFETLPCLKEAQAIVHLLRTEPPGKPAWITFSCKDETLLSHGEHFAKEALPLAFEAESLVAIGINCTPPRFVPALLRSASQAIQGAKHPPLLVAYPNSGEGWISSDGVWDGDSDLKGCDLGQVGQSWVKAGAQLVGGCCRTTPEYISSLAAALV